MTKSKLFTALFIMSASIGLAQAADYFFAMGNVARTDPKWVLINQSPMQTYTAGVQPGWDSANLPDWEGTFGNTNDPLQHAIGGHDATVKTFRADVGNGWYNVTIWPQSALDSNGGNWRPRQSYVAEGIPLAGNLSNGNDGDFRPGDVSLTGKVLVQNGRFDLQCSSDGGPYYWTLYAVSLQATTAPTFSASGKFDLGFNTDVPSGWTYLNANDNCSPATDNSGATMVKYQSRDYGFHPLRTQVLVAPATVTEHNVQANGGTGASASGLSMQIDATQAPDYSFFFRSKPGKITVTINNSYHDDAKFDKVEASGNAGTSWTTVFDDPTGAGPVNGTDYAQNIVVDAAGWVELRLTDHQGAGNSVFLNYVKLDPVRADHFWAMGSNPRVDPKWVLIDENTSSSTPVDSAQAQLYVASGQPGWTAGAAPTWTGTWGDTTDPFQRGLGGNDSTPRRFSADIDNGWYKVTIYAQSPNDANGGNWRPHFGYLAEGAPLAGALTPFLFEDLRPGGIGLAGNVLVKNGRFDLDCESFGGGGYYWTLYGVSAEAITTPTLPTSRQFDMGNPTDTPSSGWINVNSNSAASPAADVSNGTLVNYRQRDWGWDPLELNSALGPAVAMDEQIVTSNGGSGVTASGIFGEINATAAPNYRFYAAAAPGLYTLKMNNSYSADSAHDKVEASGDLGATWKTLFNDTTGAGPVNGTDYSTTVTVNTSGWVTLRLSDNQGAPNHVFINYLKVLSGNGITPNAARHWDIYN